MIRDLHVERVRGFGHFELHDLGQVNLLVGTNNSGKTTVLESLQMLSAPGDIAAIYRILFRRGEDFYDAGERGRMIRYVDLRRLFHGHEIRLGSRFDVVATTTTGVRKFSASIVEAPPPADGPQRQQLFEPDPGQVESDDLGAPLAVRLTWDEMAAADYLITLSSKGGISFEGIRRSSYALETGIGKSPLITAASLNSDAVVELFEAIVLTPEEDLVVEALKIIEPSIERIATGRTERVRNSSEAARGGILVRCKGVDNRIPIGSMGDGTWRMLGLALTLVRSANCVLLVDEIDTGLHFSVMADIWRLIYKTAKRLNVQVFATTHSRDCFESLAVICREQVGENSDITIQRIERGKKMAVGYTEREIIAASRRGMEVR